MRKTATLAISLSLFLMAAGTGFSRSERIRLGGSLTYQTFEKGLVQDLYGPGGFGWSLSLAYLPMKVMELRADYGTLRAYGSMTASQEEIRLSLLPFTFGIRFLPVRLGRLVPYLGAGAAFITYREEYPERITGVKRRKDTAYLELGAYVKFVWKIDLVLGIRYSQAKVSTFVPEETVQLGGLVPGVGISVVF